MQTGESKVGLRKAIALNIVVVGVLLLAGWWFVDSRSTPDVKALREKVRFFSNDLESMKEQLDQTRARLAVVEQEARVLRQANRLLRKDESDRQAELGRLQSELEFYGKLAGTGGAISGLDLYRVEIIATDSERVFQFILTLTQNIRRAAIISGQARIDIEGTRQDRPVTLHWSEISDGDIPPPAFRFKYFQQLEGYLTLPEDFSPTRLLVTLEAAGRKPAVKREFNWAELRND
jgi:hypothetical protein